VLSDFDKAWLTILNRLVAWGVQAIGCVDLVNFDTRVFEQESQFKSIVIRRPEDAQVFISRYGAPDQLRYTLVLTA